jgi:predicted Zn-ribbon and HTH transcriptional regulator
MKMTSVRSQDQRRMLQTNSHTFPTNAWIHKITKGKESDRCDLCKALWIAEVRFTTEKDLPEPYAGYDMECCKGP